MIVGLAAGGEEISQAVLDEAQARVDSGVSGNLSSLSEWLTGEVGWRDPQGKPCVSSANVKLRRLEAKGALELPWELKPRGELHQPDLDSLPELKAPIHGCVEKRAIGLILTEANSDEARLWKTMVWKYHPLGNRRLVGRQLRYLMAYKEEWIGALGFSASAYQVASRDKYIGWSTAARKAHLDEVVANSRFVIRPKVHVKNLGSHVVAMVTKRLAVDWQQRYGYQPLLLETFVEEGRPGTSYRASGWKEVGKTSGRGRQDRDRKQTLSRKKIFLLPLVEGWQRRLRRELPVKRAPLTSSPPKGTRNSTVWIETELGDADFGSKRLTARLVTIAKDFMAQPQASVAGCSDSNRAKVKAAYRFFSNKAVTMEKILKPHISSTVVRIREWGAQQPPTRGHGNGPRPIVLAVQDTVTLTYRNRLKNEELGYINDPKDNARGILVHDTMAFTPGGVPLGLLDVQSWARDDADFGKKAERRTESIENKESNKWLVSYEATAAAQRLLPEVTLVSVGDRESDVFELFALAHTREDHPKLLVRAEHDRNVELAGRKQKLWAALQNTEVRAKREVLVPRRSGRPKIQAQQTRKAVLQIRYAEVMLLPPSQNRYARKAGPQRAWAVYANECGAPENVAPLEWMLLTTIPVRSPHEAEEKIDWYVRRFLIEVYHKVLKSGCGIEERQNRQLSRLENALAVDMIVGWRIMHLMAMSREVPDLPCTALLEQNEWEALYLYVHQTTELPAAPPSLNEAIRMAAKLGGFLGRAGDGEPGVKSMWLGLTRLADVAAFWSLIGPKLNSAD